MNPEDYASMGWHIFPCHSIERGRCSCGKAECTSPGKHPRTRNGVKDATTDAQTIKFWETTYPDTNWGLACGRQSGLVVIDIDPKHDGFTSFDEFETARRGGPLPTTLQAISGGGGRHHFFAYPNDGESVKNRVDWLPGVDIRSDGGYVVLAPGSHISGGTYRWKNWGQEVDPLPVDVAASIRTSSKVASEAARSELIDSASILNGVPEGKRDDTIFRWACRLRRQHASDSDGGRAIVTQLVVAAAEKSNFPKGEALAKVEQAYRQDHEDTAPTWKSSAPDSGGSKGGDDNDEDEDGDAFNRLTDMGNRDRFVGARGHDLHYVPEVGWYQWAATGWGKARDEGVMRMAEVVASVVRDEAVKVPDQKYQKKFIKFADSSESAASLAATVKLAKGHQSVLRDMDDFDAISTDLACANGIVDLRTGKLRAFNRDDLTTHNTGVVYDPEADMDWWLEFIDQTTENNDQEEQEALKQYLQLAAGYTATGLNTQECFFIISGPPASGKSTYIDGLMTAIGTYATTSQSDTFMYRRGKDAAPNELARMAGQRLVSVSEIRDGDFFNEALIKQITGGDRIIARHLYHQAFEYTPQFKLWIGTNHDPISYDAAMLRRIKRIKFKHVVPYEKRSSSLKLKVRDKDAGAPAILRWIVEGATKFLNTGTLQEPASIIASAHEYRAETDIFGRFMNTSCVAGKSRTVQFTTLFATWVNWCKGMNENAGRGFSFKKKLDDHDYKVGLNDNGVEMVRGVELRAATTYSPGMEGGPTWN